MRNTNIRTVFLAILFTILAVFAVRGDMFGKGLTTALFPDRSDEAALTADSIAAADSLRAVEIADSTADAERGLRLADVTRLEPMPVQKLEKEIDDETLWLARVIYSETKRAEEQELVAWVVRNRVETGYRGKSTYEDVVLDRMQFSAFNPGTRTRARYSGLTTTSQEPGWHKALTIAHDVRHADAEYRPFSETTRHFYSEQSMKGSRHPAWAKGKSPVTPERDHTLDARRFRFFENIG